jgi:hypothetical protein
MASGAIYLEEVNPDEDGKDNFISLPADALVLLTTPVSTKSLCMPW